MTDKIKLHGLLSLSHVSCVLYHVALDSCSLCVATLVLPLPVTLLYIRLSVLSVSRFANNQFSYYTSEYITFDMAAMVQNNYKGLYAT